MKPIRSLLFVPAHKPDWVANAPFEYDADAYIYDLEDAVPEGEKGAARETLRGSYERLRESDKTITARVNHPRSDSFDDDLRGIVEPELDAIVIPKIRGPADVRRADQLLADLEASRSMDREVEIIAMLETAESIYRTHEIARTDRVVAVSCGGSLDGDLNRSIGFEWTREGREKLHFRSKALLDARAAGADQVFSGVWADVDDLEGLREECRSVRQLGYTGYCVIHPSHVDVVNEQFSPDPEEIEGYRRLLAEVDPSEVGGTGAVRFEGKMIDAAHVKTAKRRIERAEQFGVIE